jgi:uncharacterized protein
MYNRSDNYNTYEDSVSRKEGLGTYTSKVFGWMFFGLAATAVTAFFVAGSDNLAYSIASNLFLFYGLIIAEFALVIILSRRIMKINYGTAVLLFLTYSVLNGAVLSVILLVFTLSSIAYTFAVTAVAFGAMSIYGYITKTDLTRVGNILFMGLIGLIVLSIVNMFIQATALGWIISLLGLFVFLGLTAYDTQKIKEYYYRTEGNFEMARKSAIMGALRLYLDFINLFLMLLRIFGKRR